VGVDGGVGATLRTARNRRKIALSEVEAAIKVRVRHLRAIEDEDWEALPGGSYPRGFIRAYAVYLGLDGERLAAEYARQAPSAGRERGPRVEPAQIDGAAERERRRLPRAALTALVVVALVALVVVIGLATGSGGGGRAPVGTGGSGGPVNGSAGVGGTVVPRGGGTRGETVVLRLATRAEVWVCVLDARGRALVEGQVLPGGVEEGPFHSGSFTVAFGNGEVAMQVNGKETQIPASASPLGYAIDSGGRLTPLAEAERPTCL
jgi:cytoskeleton protein RodZ